jgi:membrane peptidoglycan carboxypeptidase
MSEPGRRRRSGGRGGYTPNPAGSRRPRHLLRRFLVTAGLLFLVSMLVGGGVLYTYAGELPSLSHLSAQTLPQSTRIYARDGTTLLDQRYEERRTVVPLGAVSWDLRHATIAIEDRNYYAHGAVSPVRVLAAAVYDVIHRRAAQGGSTITQQVVKNYMLETGDWQTQRTIGQKVREFLLAIQMEQRYSKDQILEMYLNKIFYGNQAFGVEAAANVYFGKAAHDLSLAEASFLAGLPQRPTLYDPFRPEGFRRARLRQHDVLAAMVRAGYLTNAAARTAYAVDLQPALTTAHDAASARHAALAPHFVDYVWSQLESRYDPSLLLRGGLTVITTLDAHTQTLAQQAVQEGVQRFSRSNGVNNSAMLVMNPHTGEILAMIGSADYFNTDIGGQNNYTLALRQPGSSFKPYTYVTALMQGWTPASILDDSDGAHAFPGYPVQDWDKREMGRISLRTSLAQSRNISSVRLFKDVGIDNVFATARRLGLTTPLEPGLSATLGANEVRMTEHLAAYSSFANGGLRVEPLAVLEVRDRHQNVLEKTTPQPDTGTRVLPEGATDTLTDILKGAVRPQLAFPAAAKSGTTTDFKDAWYIGYTTDLAVAAWMGRTVTKPVPANESMKFLWGETGPGSVWHRFMQAYYNGRKPADWARPPDVQTSLFCKDTGVPTGLGAPDLTVSEFVLQSAPAPSPAPCDNGAAVASEGTTLPLLSGQPPLPTPSASPLPVLP